MSKSRAWAAAGGIAATVVDSIVLAALVEGLGVPPALAVLVSACVGAATSFAVSHRWAFRQQGGPSPEAIGRFGVIAAGNATLAAAFVYALSYLHVPYLGSRWLAAAVTFFVWTYPAQKHWVFRATAERPERA